MEGRKAGSNPAVGNTFGIFFLNIFKVFFKKCRKKMHANRRNLQRKREKNRQKVAIFRLGMLDGAECHFRDFCFEVGARSEIPAYSFLVFDI